MNGYLRQSTASQVRTVGPFIDDVDFKSLENALSIANTDIKIKKNGGASGNKNSGGATADGAGGLYHLTWDATDTNTVGELYYSIKVAGALVVFGSYVVLEEAVYDALYATDATGVAAAGALEATTQSILTDTAEIGTAGAGLTNITLPAATVTAVADGLLKRDMSAVSGEAARSPLNALRLLRNKWTLSGGTLTVTEEDDTTTAWTAPVTTDGAAEPVTGIDPT